MVSVTKTPARATCGIINITLQSWRPRANLELLLKLYQWENSLTDPRTFTDVIVERASLYGVAPDIHENDFIFQFLIANEVFPSKEDAINYYFQDGQKSSGKVLQLISKFLKAPPSQGPISILEFASGYGCVSRHLVKVPGYEVTPSDIHPAAVSFLSEKIGLPALQSTHTPEAFAPAKTFDVVFALSFFSHMPDRSWARWLSALFQSVNLGGIFILTTHGRISAKYFGSPQLEKSGYWFRSDSEQKDLDVSEYGQTIVTPEYVFAKICELPGAWPCFFEQAYWWEHQDVYVLQRAV